MDKIIKTDCNAHFWVESFIPNKIRDEYILRWNQCRKDCFEEFYNAVRNDPDRNWWIDLNHIDRSYSSYVGGSIHSLYPKGLHNYPHEVYKSVMDDVGFQIDFL
jgi:hypothetical protein